MEPTVSIIVPVYNAEKTIRRCVESILNQQYTDWELLLIDDGSKDGSGAVCDEYAAKDARLRVIHRENGGVSAARNLALDHARGVYLQFLDSDDWITPDATSSLVRAAEGNRCDLVVADFYRVVGERLSRKGDIDEDGVLSRVEYAAHMMENPADFYYGVLWNKLYRRDIVEKHHLRMNPEISWCEDFMFNLEYIRHAERFHALQVPIYYYVKTEGSLVNSNVTISRTIKMKLTVFEYYQQFYKSVLNDEEYDKSRLKVYRFLLDVANDGAVLPLPGSQRLGEERPRISPVALQSQGILGDAFRERRLLEFYLKTAALKHDIAVSDAVLLLAVEQLDAPCTRKELADFAHLSRGGLAMSLQRLEGKKLLISEETRGEGYTERLLRLTPTELAKPVLDDLATARHDYQSACFAGFQPEEAEEYQRLSQKVQANIREILT